MNNAAVSICVHVFVHMCFLFFFKGIFLVVVVKIFFFGCSVQLLSCVRLLVTPWTAALQASLSIANSQSLLRLMSIESVMPSNHRPLLFPSPPAFSLSQHQGLFQ